MKKLLLLLLLVTINVTAQGNPDKFRNGIKTPFTQYNELTSTQKLALPQVAGTVVYDTTLDKLQVFDGVNWVGYFNAALDTADNIIEGNTNKFITVFERAKLDDIVFDGIGFSQKIGVNAGVGNNSTSITATGYGASLNSIGSDITATGRAAAENANGNGITATGRIAAIGAIGSNITATGRGAAQNANGNGITATGFNSASLAFGNGITATGSNSASNAYGQNITAIGENAGSFSIGNTLQTPNSTAIGANTIIDKANQAAIGNAAVTELKIGETLVIDKAQIVSQPDGVLVNKNINGKSVVQSNNHILLEKTNTIPKPMIQLGGTGRTDVLTLGQGVTTAFEHTTSNFNAFSDASIINMANDDGTGYGSFDVSTKVIGNHYVDHLFGYQCRMEYGSSVPMPFNSTFGSMTTMWSQNRVSTGSAVSTATGFYYQDVVGGGTLSNQYAIVIEPLTKGTNFNWGVFSLADNYLKTVKSDFFRGNGSLITDVDALTLDGLGSDDFKKEVVSASIDTNTDPNTVTISSVTTNHANTPDSNFFWHIETYFYATTSANRYQTAKQNNGGNNMYIRNNINGIWSAWAKVFTNNNDGSGSGLDADLLDGLHASSFLRTDVNSQTNSNVKLNLRGTIPGQDGSGSALQVNGFMRTGNIFLHSGGLTPNSTFSNNFLSNTNQDLYWTKNNVDRRVFTEGEYVIVTGGVYATDAAAGAAGVPQNGIYKAPNGELRYKL